MRAVRGDDPAGASQLGDDPIPRLEVVMNWLLLGFAGLLEVGWAVGLKYTEGFTRPWPTVASERRKPNCAKQKSGS